MKAVLISKFGGPDKLEMQEVDVPLVKENQVLIRVFATSVNFADIMARQGLYHAGGKPPLIPGLDVAGIIEQVGDKVTKFKVGQRVIAFPKHGSYAEFVAADEDLTFVLPENVDFVSAAASPIVAFTSYKLLADVGRLQPGESVLIHAASGGIGTTAIQLAKLLGAGLVIGTVGHEQKRSVALEAGADVVICNDKQDFAAEANKLTDNKGVDLVLDSIGGTVTKRNLECLAMYGRLVIFGHASGQAGQIETKDLHASCRAVLGFSLGTTRNHRPELFQDTADKVLNYMSQGLLKIRVGKVFPLAEAAKAHQLMESREHSGKIVLQVNH